MPDETTMTPDVATPVEQPAVETAPVETPVDNTVSTVDAPIAVETPVVEVPVEMPVELLPSDEEFFNEKIDELINYFNKAGTFCDVIHDKLTAIKESVNEYIAMNS